MSAQLALSGPDDDALGAAKSAAARDYSVQMQVKEGRKARRSRARLPVWVDKQKLQEEEWRDAALLLALRTFRPEALACCGPIRAVDTARTRSSISQERTGIRPSTIQLEHRADASHSDRLLRLMLARTLKASPCCCTPQGGRTAVLEKWPNQK